MTPGERARACIHSGETQMMAIVSNILTAKLADIAGFPLIILGGSALGGDKLLVGDWGLVTPDDLAEAIFRITETVAAPVIADGDDGGGMGGPLNVYSALRKYEKAGAAGMLIEDMTGVKHMGSEFPEGMIMTREAMIDNIRAAVDARTDPNFVIFVRCDALFRPPTPAARAGALAEMHERLQAYAQAGGDVVFASGMPPEDIEGVMRRTGKAIMVNGVTLEVARQKKANIFLMNDPIAAARGVIHELLAEARQSGEMKLGQYPALPADIRRKLLDMDAVEARARKYNAFNPVRAIQSD